MPIWVMIIIPLSSLKEINKVSILMQLLQVTYCSSVSLTSPHHSDLLQQPDFLEKKKKRKLKNQKNVTIFQYHKIFCNISYSYNLKSRYYDIYDKIYLVKLLEARWLYPYASCNFYCCYPVFENCLLSSLKQSSFLRFYQTQSLYVVYVLHF